MIELQACLRVIAQSRRDQDRKHTPVLPRLFALLHWPSPPLWGSWISVEFPVHRSSNPFSSACALMLRSRLRILVLLAFFEEGAGITLRQECRYEPHPYFFTLKDTFGQVPRYSAGVSFLLQGVVSCSFLKFPFFP